MSTDPMSVDLDTAPRSEADVVTGLTNRQALFWLGQELSGDDPVYDIAFVYEIQGPIEPDRFREAFAETIATSDALRVVIEVVDGMPMQRVLAHLPYELEVVDLTAAGDPDARLRELVDERLARSMPMGERLFDTALYRLAPDRFAWFLNQHHIITDGASMAILFQRVSSAYERLASGSPPLAPPSYPSYLDYVDRERELRQSSTFERAERYRLKKLARELPTVRFYRAEEPRRSRHERRAVLRIDRERARRLREVATAEGMPTERPEQALFLVFSTLLASYVHRVNGHRDIGMGMVFHNRLSEAERQTAGLYVNLFPLQFEIDEAESFHTLMRKSMTESFAAVRYGPYCISNPGRKRSYEILLNYLPMKYPSFAGHPTRIEWAHSGACDGNQSLSLHVHDFEGSGELSLVFDFNSGVFDEAERARALAEFDELVDRFIADPQQPVALGLDDEVTHERLFAADPGAAAPDPAAERSLATAPRGATEIALARIWEDLLGRAPIAATDNFFDLGGHSLLAVSLVGRVEERLGVRLPLTRLFDHPTIRELAAWIGDPGRASAPAGAADDDILIRVRRSGSKRPFFCVPGAGGYAFRVLNIARHLDAERPVYGFRPLVGEAAESLEEMAATYCAELRSVQPSGPYLLGGTCLGALIAYEMAQRLTAAGEEVRALVLMNVQGEVDYRFYRWAGAWLDRLYARFGVEAPRRHDRVIDLIRVAKALHRGARREGLRLRRPFSREARAEWQRTWAGTAEAHAEHRAIGFAQTRSALSYRPAPYAGPIHVMLASRVRARRLYDERSEWGALARGPLEFHVVEGGHYSVLEEPLVAGLGRAVSRALDARDEPEG